MDTVTSPPQVNNQLPVSPSPDSNPPDQGTARVAPSGSGGSSRFSKKSIILGTALLLITVALVGGIFLVQRRQKLSSSAQTTLPVTPTGLPIDVIATSTPTPTPTKSPEPNKPTPPPEKQPPEEPTPTNKPTPTTPDGPSCPIPQTIKVKVTCTECANQTQ